MQIGELGGRIRERREQRGLRQQDIAHALQVSPQAVSKWERGENAPDITILGALAGLLGVSTDWLLGRDARREGDTFEATVFVSSVLGAFGKSREMHPRDFAVWANGLFYSLTESVLRHEGVPIKYMGDQFLAFFSGAEHERRAVAAARLALATVGDALRIGLSSGPVYLGAVGHPKYSRPDIMGEVVNAAFLTMQWGESHAASGLAATASVVEAMGEEARALPGKRVRFRGIAGPVVVHELRRGNGVEEVD